MKKHPTIAGKSYIYALADPFTMQVRYVGQAHNVTDRFRAHLVDDHFNERKGEWVRGCVLRGQRPILVILEHVASSEANEKESQWIRSCQTAGYDLLNYHLRIPESRYLKSPPKSLYELRMADMVIGNMSREIKYQLNNLLLLEFTWARCLRMARKRIMAAEKMAKDTAKEARDAALVAERQKMFEAMHPEPPQANPRLLPEAWIFVTG